MQCIMNPDYDELSYTLQEKIVVARKNHCCGECGCTISPGMKYELYKGVMDSTIFTAKTCLDCISIREAFFQNNAQFGSVLDDVREHIIYELGGEVDSKCILPLTKTAKLRVFEYIEEAFSR